MDISVQVNKQREFFKSGQTLEYSFRLEALEKLSFTISEMESKIVAALASDLNKSEIESFMTEIGIVQSEIKYAIKNLAKWIKKRKHKTPLMLFPAKSYSIPEPYGVVLIMSPWNYPFMLTIIPLIGAIAAGNCPILKPSAYSPAVSNVIYKLISNCFDDNYCSVILGSRKENKELLKQRFDYIFFTGSLAVGQLVMEAASRYLTPITLELGGKSPVIVDKTSDIDLAAKRLVFGKYMNAGQTCVAPDYVLVDKNKKTELIEKLQYYINYCYPKNTNDEVIDYPQIINQKHFERLCQLMHDENIVIGGKTYPEKLSIEPTVLVDVSFDAPIMQEEIFGPLLPIIEYEKLDEAISEIQSRPKPLALYLFSSDKSVWRKIEKNITFGGGCINDCLMHVSSLYLPFGGVGDSGIGNYHGKASFDTFSHYKSMVNKSTKIDFDVRYRPYDEKKKKLIHKLLK